MDLKTHIGVKVKAARLDRGLTQERLADAVGKAVETISNIERGHAQSGLDTLAKISEVLDVPMSYFFTDLDGARRISKVRLEAEERLRTLTKSMRDDDLPLAVELLEAVARRRKK
jgi:transcriptional regulator with XRE-family HTH domain